MENLFNPKMWGWEAGSVVKTIAYHEWGLLFNFWPRKKNRVREREFTNKIDYVVEVINQTNKKEQG